ncbi:hypothetical protein BGZ65_001384 [Modicella reniformis]|uniref:tRNA-5-taurinomethyluridine 2-sulfurtransferase n=1 Tax=Modicella reniformis TaxID=1440133 RepID=A0A9P6MJ07_9FUNG|nr:hypothetical protein BGZ65_001384 [Modicella reniformis]
MHNWNHQEETQDEFEFGPLHQREPTPSSPSESNSGTLGGTRIRPKICMSDRDWGDVQAICKQLGIPARRLDFSRHYWNQVFEVMLQEYEHGRTPNPDITCNREIKFGKLIEWCNGNGGLGKDRHKSHPNSDSPEQQPELGWDYLATGHYARVERDPETGRAKLMRALDSNKDQTYYLSELSEQVLRNVIFPLARYDKPTVKRMAMETGVQQLKNSAMKKESMGICFVGQRRRFGEFLQEYLESKPGPVKINGADGPVIGKHRGLFRYTVGQASGVTYGPENQNERLFSSGLVVESWHWIAGAPPKKLLQLQQDRFMASDEGFPFSAQIRHRQKPQPCTIELIRNHSDQVSNLAPAQSYAVRFKDTQRAIAPGQTTLKPYFG